MPNGTAANAAPDPATPARKPTPARLFFEYLKISAFVVGGGYAIIAVADEVFGRRLRWLREGELVDRLPVFQMVPGLIAGNSAIYVGLKLFGLAGAATALAAVALPSFCIILAVARGYSWLPMDSQILQGVFLGLRSALAGVVAATLVSSWRRTMRGAYAWIALPAGVAAMECFGANPAHVLVAGMLFGVAWTCGRAALGRLPPPAEDAGAGEGAVFAERPIARGLFVAALASAAVAACAPAVFATFAKFGLLCFGGGNVLVPVYIREFVGPDAPHLQLPAEDFGNLLAITQMTPGPISVNAATFFGYRMEGAPGSLVATAGLLAPSFFLLALALRSLAKWRRNPVVRGLLWGVAPATVALMVVATLVFARMSVFVEGTWSLESVWRAACGVLVVDGAAADNLLVRPLPLLLAAGAGLALRARKAHVTTLILACAAVGALLPRAIAWAPAGAATALFWAGALALLARAVARAVR
ncbi:MAG: chromate transporter [Kiritimatiellae bacterium]|nr:chromate transporter [Kiritimatiellia bacterium]